MFAKTAFLVVVLCLWCPATLAGRFVFVVGADKCSRQLARQFQHDPRELNGVAIGAKLRVYVQGQWVPAVLEQATTMLDDTITDVRVMLATGQRVVVSILTRRSFLDFRPLTTDPLPDPAPHQKLLGTRIEFRDGGLHFHGFIVAIDPAHKRVYVSPTLSNAEIRALQVPADIAAEEAPLLKLMASMPWSHPYTVTWQRP